MPPPKTTLPPEIQERIASATTDLAGAEQDLLTILESLPAEVRAEKRIVSSALQGALSKLSDAKKRLKGVLTNSDD